MEQMARLVSAGMPTSQGSQYFGIFDLAIHHQGCTNRLMFRSCIASKIGNSSGWFRFQLFTWLPIWMPRRPSALQRSSSWMARSVCCIGRVPRPT